MVPKYHPFYLYQAQTSPIPFGIEIERAKGLYLYGPDGKRYIDFISGIGVANIGHNHPRVIEAIKTQVDKHLHVMVYGEYLQKAQYLLAQKLNDLLPGKLETTYVVNSGTEAIEGALKLAKRKTKRTEIIAFEGSYHGNSQGSLSVSANEKKKNAFRPLLPDIHFLPFNQIPELEAITERTAAVIIETVQGDAGIRIPSANFLRALREKCNETGAVLIFDEIQAGMGRCGRLFAFEVFDVVPDILVLGKALGGGMPIGAFISSYETMQLLTHNPMLGHITTFGGHPVICAAALATLEVFEKEIDYKDVKEKGNYLAHQLKHPLVKEIRQIGMFFAIELDSFDVVNQVVKRNLEKGLISYWFLSTNHAFRIAPPLNISYQQMDEAIAIIRSSMDEVYAAKNNG